MTTTYHQREARTAEALNHALLEGFPDWSQISQEHDVDDSDPPMERIVLSFQARLNQ